MRIHHLSCGSHCPFGGALYDGFSRAPFARISCNVQLIETASGLVLVDTGFGVDDVRAPYPRLSRSLGALFNTRFSLGQTALHQVKALGFAPGDVRDIIVTSLDFDHAGGLEDFPFARVHVTAAEREAAEQRRGLVARRRYRPAQWRDIFEWRTYSGAGERWFGFEAVRDLDGLPPEILLVPLPGHSPGQVGVAIRAEDDKWILNAGDAYGFREEMDVERPRRPPGSKGLQALMASDRDLLLANQARLRELKREHGADVLIFCAHDAIELAALQSVGPIEAIETRAPARTPRPKPAAAAKAASAQPAARDGGAPLH